MRNAWMTCLALAGCSWGLGDEVTFQVQNLDLEAELQSARFASEDTAVGITAFENTLERGVVVEIDGSSGADGLGATLTFDGNLGALCRGAEVQLERQSGQLEATRATGAPMPMSAELEALSLSMNTRGTVAGDAVRFEPERMTLRAVEIEGSNWARIEFRAEAEGDNGETESMEGNFDIVRMVQSRDLDSEVSWD